MRRSILWRILPVAAILLALTSTAEAAPKISFEKSIIEFGILDQGQKFEAVFPFRNLGDSDLTIGQIYACGCISATASKKKLRSGESAEIKVTFNSSGYNGKITKSITVENNDPNSQIAQLQLKGQVKPSVEVIPERIKMGAVKMGPAYKTTVTLKPADPDKFQIKSITINSKFITAGKPRKSSDTPGAWVIPITINTKDFPTGTVFETIVFNTNVPAQPMVIVTVQGMITAN